MIRALTLASASSALAALLLMACEPEGDTPPVGSSATPAVTNRTGADPTLNHSPGDVPDDLTEAMVTRVVDGDTIYVSIDGEEFRVRYIGIDTPETVDPRRPVGCFGIEASQKNRELVEGRAVGLEKDVSETDLFGRLLRYVWIDKQMVNATLVAGGYATAASFPPDVKHAELFLNLQRAARDAGFGLWGESCTSPTPAPADGECEYSSSGEPTIKGNISLSTGERIHHVPGGEFYDRTIIDEAAGERWFCTEAEALDAGWRRSLR